MGASFDPGVGFIKLRREDGTLFDPKGFQAIFVGRWVRIRDENGNEVLYDPGSTVGVIRARETLRLNHGDLVKLVAGLGA